MKKAKSEPRNYGAAAKRLGVTPPEPVITDTKILAAGFENPPGCIAQVDSKGYTVGDTVTPPQAPTPPYVVETVDGDGPVLSFTVVDDHDELVGRPSTDTTEPITRADPPAVDENNHPTYDVPITDKTHAVHHIDGNLSNNDLSNLAVVPVAENRRLLYRKVPGTNVSRADAVAYARKNWPFGSLGKPPSAGFEWMQESIKHTMSWETFAQEPAK